MRLMRMLVLGALIGVVAALPGRAIAQDGTPTEDEIRTEIQQLRERLAELEAMLPLQTVTLWGMGEDLTEDPFYLAEGTYRVTAICTSGRFGYFEAHSTDGRHINLISVDNGRETDAPVTVQEPGDYFLYAACSAGWSVTLAPLAASR